jgi:hypothetical protein
MPRRKAFDRRAGVNCSIYLLRQRMPSLIIRSKDSSGRGRETDEGKTPALGDHQARELLAAPRAGARRRWHPPRRTGTVRVAARSALAVREASHISVG